MCRGINLLSYKRLRKDAPAQWQNLPRHWENSAAWAEAFRYRCADASSATIPTNASPASTAREIFTQLFG